MYVDSLKAYAYNVNIYLATMKSFLIFVFLGFITVILFGYIGAQYAGDDGAVVGVLVAFIFAIYLLPTYVGYARRHPNGHSIFALNLFLGWTLLGWVFSLVWSLKNFKYKQPVEIIE